MRGLAWRGCRAGVGLLGTLGFVDGMLAQASALVGYGNAYLAINLKAAEHLESRNSTFQYVRSIRFVWDSKPRWRHAEATSHSVAEWLKDLRRRKVERLSLYLPGAATPSDAAWANASAYAVLAYSPNELQSWFQSEEVNRAGVDDADPKPRIWEVTYQATSRSESASPPTPDLVASAAELRDAVNAASAFALNDEFLGSFRDWFRASLELLEADEPEVPWHPDVLPSEGYPLAARRLMAASSRAWVFGGMGSWNDGSFEPVEEYRAVSSRLYRAVLNGIRDSVGAFDPG